MRRADLIVGLMCFGMLATASSARADGPPGNLPRWCAGFDGRTETSAGSIEDEAKNTGYATDRVAHTIARGACGWRSHEEDTRKIRDKVAAGRAKFRAATGLSDAETDELFTLEFDTKRAEAENQAFCKSVKVDEDAAPHDRSQAQARTYLVCDTNRGGGDYDWPDLTEIEKVAQVNNCFRHLQENFNSDTDKFAQAPHPMLEFARCNVLASRIDPKRYMAEVAADKRFNRYATLWAKAALNDTRLRTEIVEARYKKIAGKKPAFQDLLFTAPEKGYSEFLAMYRANQELVDKAAFLIAGSGKLEQLAKSDAGCAAKFEPVVVNALATKHPTTMDGIKDAFRDTFTFYMGMAFATCEALDDHPLVANAYAEPLRGVPAPGAPVEAAEAAALDAMFDNVDDIPGARDVTVQHIGPKVPLDVRAPSGTTEAQAVIAKVAPGKDHMVKLTFKQDTWIEELESCKETNKIDRIENGKLIYRQVCHAAGTKKHVTKEAPVLVEARFAGALEAGRFVEMRVLSAGRVALPIKVFSGKDRKQLVGYLGFTL